MSTWVQTSKYGDILSALPMIHHDYIKSGVKPQLVAVAPYNKLAEDLGYVQVQTFGGSMQDLSGAIKFAKESSRDVKVTQLHGKGFEFHHRHPSFQYDQWDRGGMLDKWDKLPLVLPRKWEINPEYVKLGDPQPTIIFADHSQSSPFPHKEELAKLLIENFPSHQIVRLSSIQAPHLFDLLALMDAADLIVTVETSHLHLSKACSKPVIALVTDKPSRWHGSAWSSRFSMHCRYSDFPRRKDELIRTARGCIEKKLPINVRSCSSTSNRFCYNLSMILHGDVMITTHRYHPAKDWKTVLAINDGVLTSDIKFPSEFDGYSFEDARLFHHNGKLMMTYVLSTESFGQFKSVVGYGMLVQREGRWEIPQNIQPVYRNNDFSGMVKNLCPFEHDGKIHFIWGNSNGEQMVIQVDGAKVSSEFKSEAPTWDHGEIRGGSVVMDGDRMIRFFHSRTGDGLNGAHGTFQYHIGASIMESKPPFKTISVSKYPIISGDERYVPGCFHWKPNVAIVYGAISKGRQGQDLIQISIGRNDSSCEIVNLTESDLNL
jgi:predicted GH43/DUF377 family glycosyl hydrolase